MKTLKKEWKGITDRVKNVSGLAVGEEPEWYQHINPILAETNEEINPTSSALQTAFVNRDESDLESGSEDEDLKCVPTNKLYLNWQGLCRTWQNPKLRD